MKKTPSQFKAHCRIGHAPDTILFEEPDLFEAHMLHAHRAKPGMCAERSMRKVNGQTVYGPIVGFASMCAAKQLRLGKGLWTGPRLTEEATAFEPAGLEPGATVTWRELVPTGERVWDQATGERQLCESVERSGQVWCAGWRPKSVWVVPFDLLEGEQAVMVVQRSNGELEHYSTQMSPGRRAA